MQAASSLPNFAAPARVIGPVNVRVLLLWALLAVAGPALAQENPHRGHVDGAGRRAIPRLDHPRFVVLYDSRYSILNHHFGTINGLKAGIEFRNRFRTGAAVYFLSTGFPTRQANPPEADPDTDGTLRFRYLAGYAEYVLLESRRWELSASMQLGLGSASVVYQDVAGATFSTRPRFLGITEPSLLAQYKLFHWAGAGVGVGWRQPVFVPVPIQRELNGPVFYARAKFFLGDFIHLVRHHEPLFSQDGLRPEPPLPAAQP